MHSRKYSLSDSSEWKLVVSAEVWFCISRCWDEDIFIRQLAHRYLKFLPSRVFFYDKEIIFEFSPQILEVQFANFGQVQNLD